MSTHKNFEIAIVGGGIAGLTLAIALYHRKIPVKLYERAAKFGEIGAGVSFTPNAIQAMKICHEGIFDAFEACCTRNGWEEKQKVWFDFFDGMTGGPQDRPSFSIVNERGQNAVHRARYLDELVKLVPIDIAEFRKILTDITENKENGRMVMHFEDGTTADTDAIVGCDGIKSIVRQIIVGADHPSAHPSYSHKYAYRGLVPMDQAIEAVGREKAENACMHLGPDGHLLSFPVDHGRTLNLVALHHHREDWPDYQKFVKIGSRDDALRDFAGFGENVQRLLQLTTPELPIWALFDLGDNPVPTFYKGRVCIIGDAAHATSPHHGAGAGLCIEDAAVLAHLLNDESVQSSGDLEAAFATFDACRRARAQWLVRSSRVIGDCFQWRAPGIGSDFQKIEEEINTRNAVIANVNVADMCEAASVDLQRLNRFARL